LESLSKEDALQVMSLHKTRRLAVVDLDRRLVGVLALDDVLELLSDEYDQITQIVTQRRERPPLLSSRAPCGGTRQRSALAPLDW
jgi:CBS domain-containing protein